MCEIIRIMKTMIENGESVIIILHSPREKVFGVLGEINASGVFVRGVDLNYFDEWVSAIKANEPHLPMQDQFFPMWRVERISKDESSENLPSMREKFEQMTGIAFTDF